MPQIIIYTFWRARSTAQGGTAMASAEDVAKGLRVAEQEMDYRVDLFNRCGDFLRIPRSATFVRYAARL